MTRTITKARMLGLVAASALFFGGPAMAQTRTFEKGSLIIPMDTDYQDQGMFKAYGLLYRILLADIQVYWIIAPDKDFGGTDMTTSARDVQTSDVIDQHGYRGGPFVVESQDATSAMAVITAWQDASDVTVHQATASFDGYVSRIMTVAPTIAVFADGNEDIAFGYLNAAAIPDSAGQTWPDRKDKDRLYPGYPDVLSVAEVRGPSVDVNDDGALFDSEGLPMYCQLMTMHWGVNERDDAALVVEVAVLTAALVAEVVIGPRIEVKASSA